MTTQVRGISRFIESSTSAAAPIASMYEEYKEPLFAAPPLLSRMVDAGLLGRKSGRGFYDYTATA
jgi:3-hydroxyacyl-CoA dehydrogenase